MSEEVVFELVKSKCLSVLMYGLDVCPSNSADTHFLQFSVNKVIYKIFGAMGKDSYMVKLVNTLVYPLWSS